MGEARALASPATRLKREDYHRTKHDPNFSKWQVLVGPTDWEDHSLGKEGATRYRVHNLPASSAPGLYELGVARSSARLGLDDVVVVYLGQADNVRTRLQSYGRSGAHLGSKYSCGGCSASDTTCAHKGPALFDAVFRTGFSVVFRWAPMEDKRNAERTEAQLLDTFDYAWNKGANGLRRPNDILEKLNEVSSSTVRFPRFSKRLLRFGRGGVGIRIGANKPLQSNEDRKSFLSWIFKSSTSQPAFAPDKFDSAEDLDPVLVRTCGIVIDHGAPCKRPPIPGRRRCEEHKGMKMCRSVFDGNSNSDTTIPCDGRYQQKETACGVKLGEGTFCRKPAVSGRKRCEEHRGMKVNSCPSEPKAEEKTSTLATVGANPADPIMDNASSSNTSQCGATLENGSFCRRRPARGNKRCWQHRGSKDGAGSSRLDSCSLVVGGVALQDGSVCMAAPVPGRKRCELHKGMRVAASSCI